MKIQFLFAWYDLWIGLFWDSKKRWLYILPIPMCGVIVKFPEIENYFPEFIKLGKSKNCKNFSYMRSSTTGYTNGYQYWLDAGRWGVTTKLVSGRFFFSKKRMIVNGHPVEHLNGLEAFPSNEEEYAQHNRGYYTKVADRTVSVDHSDHDLPF